MDRTLPRSVLAGMADELDQARAGVDGLARLVSDLVLACPPAERAEVLGQAQAVDVLEQRLQALAGFVRDLAAGRNPSSAAAAIPLAEVAARLGGGPEAPEARASAGDLEMFD